MRWSGFVALCFATAAAAPPPPARAVRKPAPPGLGPDQIQRFANAIMADKAGDLEAAARHYQGANREAPQANIVYNLADIYRRMDELDRAIAGYRQYLELAPKAPDRTAVTQLIARLERTPGTVVIDGNDLDAIVFLDGTPLGPSPQIVQLPERAHLVERIGPASYGHRTVTPRPRTHTHVSLKSFSPEPGNVVFSTSVGGLTGSWQDRGHRFQIPGRFTLPPGRHDTFLLEPGRACEPIVFDVPPGDDVVVHVFVEQPERAARRGGCVPIRVRASKLQFPGRAK